MALLSGDQAGAEALLAEWQAVFPDRFYLELQRTARVNDEEHVHAAVALADRCGAALVATNDASSSRAISRPTRPAYASARAVSSTTRAARATSPTSST